MEFFTPSLLDLSTLAAFPVADAAAAAAKKGAANAKRREAPADKDLEKDKPKRGRKLAPLPEEPENKRLAQNRIAQRAFRERKVNHVKELETKVAELTAIIEGSEQMASVLQVAELKQKVKELEERNKQLVEENQQLRQMTFSFDPKQAELSPVEEMDASNSLFMTPSSLNSFGTNADFANLMMPSISPTAASIANVNDASSFLEPTSQFQQQPISPSTNTIPTTTTSATTPPSVLDFMSLLNFDTFRNTPPAPGMDAFLFDDMELESLLMAPQSNFAPVVPPPPVTTAPAVVSNLPPTKPVMPLENLKNCMSHKASISPDSMTLQFGCVSKALTSVPALSEKCELVDELCNLFVDFTTECDVKETRLACPAELISMKQKVLQEAGEPYRGYVEGVFDQVKVQFQQHLQRKGIQS
ncbi:hypothetical protein BDR26DRAFT_915367 [Obelidium mucronatum]|nr:hypothetical protein BDR26DRAFT_915367 [Obelidium mucronatum]